MLIYVQLFGGAVQRTLPLDVRSDCSVGELQRRIRQLHPELAIKRCIFAGKQLDDDAKTIGQWVDTLINNTHSRWGRALGHFRFSSAAMSRERGVPEAMRTRD